MLHQALHHHFCFLACFISLHTCPTSHTTPSACPLTHRIHESLTLRSMTGGPSDGQCMAHGLSITALQLITVQHGNHIRSITLWIAFSLLCSQLLAS